MALHDKAQRLANDVGHPLAITFVLLHRLLSEAVTSNLAFIRQIEHIAASQTVLMIFEDAHWSAYCSSPSCLSQPATSIFGPRAFLRYSPDSPAWF
jgi:hypothetical protein